MGEGKTRPRISYGGELRGRDGRDNGVSELGQGIFWQTVCQLRLAIGKANCGTPHLPTRDG